MAKDKELLLKLDGVTKDFGNGKGAFEVSLEIEPGEIVGFLGPNGAGKTTTMQMATGFTTPDSGSVEMFGSQLTINNAYQFNHKLGFLFGEAAFPENLTAVQIFTHRQKILGLRSENWRALAETLDVELYKNFGDLSMGNKKKIGIIMALMNQPTLAILDEPTSGLDPLMQQRFLEMLKFVKRVGGSVFLSSHVLSEVQAACDRIIMIKDGRIFMDKSKHMILEKALKVFRFIELSKKNQEKIAELPYRVRIEHIGNETLFYTNDKEEMFKFLLKEKIYDFYLERVNLEQMFLNFYQGGDDVG